MAYVNNNKKLMPLQNEDEMPMTFDRLDKLVGPTWLPVSEHLEDIDAMYCKDEEVAAQALVDMFNRPISTLAKDFMPRNTAQFRIFLEIVMSIDDDGVFHMYANDAERERGIQYNIKQSGGAEKLDRQTTKIKSYLKDPKVRAGFSQNTIAMVDQVIDHYYKLFTPPGCSRYVY